MATALLVLGLVVAAVLFVVAASAAIAGIVSWFAGERIERCPHCNRYAMTTAGDVHRDGCPHRGALHLGHAARPHGYRLRHH
jgi:hypothetical protein